MWKCLKTSSCDNCLYLQHTGEWPDSGGGWHQSGGSHPTVCCYSPEEHKRHSEVSSKSIFRTSKTFLYFLVLELYWKILLVTKVSHSATTEFVRFSPGMFFFSLLSERGHAKYCCMLMIYHREMKHPHMTSIRPKLDQPDKMWIVALNGVLTTLHSKIPGSWLDGRNQGLRARWLAS